MSHRDTRFELVIMYIYTFLFLEKEKTTNEVIQERNELDTSLVRSQISTKPTKMMRPMYVNAASQGK